MSIMKISGKTSAGGGSGTKYLNIKHLDSSSLVKVKMLLDGVYVRDVL